MDPGGAPSADGQRWARSGSRHPRDRDKPYLVDNRVLSARFRDKFVAELTKLHRSGQLKLTAEWSDLQDPAAFANWLKPLTDCDWVVFIEPPPTEHAKPEQVVKYLARYLTGGPISDQRLIKHQDGKVTFWARGLDKAKGNQREPYTLTGTEFTRRWAMHILPKGFVKSRCYGGFSCRHRKSYLGRCRQLLAAEQSSSAQPEATTAEPAGESEQTRRCPRCQTPMTRISQDERLSWREVLNGSHRPPWYDPFHDTILWGCVHGYGEPPDG